jgi:hypothetical protein
MALFFDGMPCALCRTPLDTEQSFFATSGVWLPDSNQLAKFCDTVMHWDCYAPWKYRRQFARSYFEFWVNNEQQNPYWWRSYLDANILVTVNPSEAIGGTWVHLAETGSRFEAPLHTWEDWLAAADDAGHEIERIALEAAKASLRQMRPTSESLIGSIDENSKVELFRKLKDDESLRTTAAEKKRLEILEHNALCERVMPIILQSTYRCPSCGQKSKDFRLSTSAGRVSLIICRQCGHVVDPRVFTSAIGKNS